MSDFIAWLLDLVVLIAIFPITIFGIYYASLMFYFAMMLTMHRRKGAPLTWHDGWGILRFGQIAYSELLDQEGQLLRAKMIFAVKRFLLFAVCGLILTALHEIAKIIAPLEAV